MSTNPLNPFQDKPTISENSVSIEDLYVHYRHDLPGELEIKQGLPHHLITFFITDNKRQITHFDGHGEYDGQMNQGEFYLYPAGISGFTCWQTIDETLHLVIKPNLLRRVAIETECLNPDKVELLPVLKKYDPQIEQLAKLLAYPIKNDDLGGRLYLESLSNIFSIHLLRNYCVFEPVFRKYTHGLTPSKLSQTLDYIHAHLNQDLSLETMAKEVEMSRCYFADQFKQAMGISPHQYVNQQRIEKAKQLIQQQKGYSNALGVFPIDNSSKRRSLAEISLDCGFASQSHLNKLFLKYVGMTPKKYLDQL
jgi:AraC family transcriptional regulator